MRQISHAVAVAASAPSPPPGLLFGRPQSQRPAGAARPELPKPDSYVEAAVILAQATPETITDGSYPLSRPLFIYVNREDLQQRPEVAGFVRSYLEATAGATFVPSSREQVAAVLDALVIERNFLELRRDLDNPGVGRVAIPIRGLVRMLRLEPPVVRAES